MRRPGYIRRPEVVEILAHGLQDTAFLHLLAGVLFGLVSIILLAQNRLTRELAVAPLFAMYGLLGGIFFHVLARDFYSFKLWAYRVVCFMAFWGFLRWSMMMGKGGLLYTEEVRHAFGLDLQSEQGAKNIPKAGSSKRGEHD